MTLDDLITRLHEELPEGFDWDLTVDIGRETAWGAHLRVTPEPNRQGAPDRSFVTFAGGGGTAEQCAIAVVNDALAWLAEMREPAEAEA